MAEFPTNNYTPRLMVVDGSADGTLTRVNVKAMTKESFADQGLMEVGMDKTIAATTEARLAGVKENALYDLFLSSHVSLPETRSGSVGNGSVIAPYSLVPRRNVVNANYFQAESGAAHPSAGSNGLHAGAWNLTVNAGTSPWNSTSRLKSLEKFFLPGNNIAVEYIDGNNAYQIANFEIVEAVNANSGSTEKATVTLRPPFTDAGWAALTSGEKAVYQPTTGVVSLLGNSVSDYESWGHQTPSINDLSLIEYWSKTHRWCHTYNDEYVEALEAPLTSDWFKKFASLPLAKQRKQQEELNQRILLNDFFYGDRISEVQTVETYTQLPVVLDPANENFPIEFKANTIGIRPQIALGGRCTDKAGLALNLDTWFESNYSLSRYRGGAPVIDWMTDRITRGLIRDQMIKYYKSRYSADISMFWQPRQQITDAFNKAVMEYDIYDLPDQGVQVAVFSPDYFWDKLAEWPASQKNGGRALWAIDWSDVSVNVLRTNSVKRTTDEADELYRYVMKVNKAHTQLNSKTFEVRVGDTNRHMLIENFSPEVPTSAKIVVPATLPDSV